MNIAYKKEDLDFDAIFSSKTRSLSKIHWTPLEIAKVTTLWLSEVNDAHILDIGAGVGKFCLYGSQISKAQFTGVEIRQNLVDEANQIIKKNAITNVNMICSDIVNIDFKSFNAFYYFNPFGEQTSYAWIDDTLEFNEYNKTIYETYVYNQLNKMPKGTRVATFCTSSLLLPNEYRLQISLFNGELLFWEK